MGHDGSHAGQGNRILQGERCVPLSPESDDVSGIYSYGDAVEERDCQDGKEPSASPGGSFDFSRGDGGILCYGDGIACYYKNPQAEKEIKEDYQKKINILRYGACKTLIENQMEE